MLLNNFFKKFIYLLLPPSLRKTVCSNRTWSSQHFSYWVSPSYAFENNDNWGISNIFCNFQFSLYIQLSFTLSYYVLILWKLETTEAPCSKALIKQNFGFGRSFCIPITIVLRSILPATITIHVMADLCGILNMYKALNFLSHFFHHMLWWLLFLNFLSQKTKTSLAAVKQFNSLNYCSQTFWTSHLQMDRLSFLCTLKSNGLRTCFATEKAKLGMYCHQEGIPLGYLLLQHIRTQTQAYVCILHT